MNLSLLTNLLGDRVLVEIDWVAGCRPAPKAIAALEARARNYLPSGKTIEILLDDEIPREEWEAHGSSDTELAIRYLDNEPTGAAASLGETGDDGGGDTGDGDDLLAAGTEVVYLFYEPRSSIRPGLYGVLTQWTFVRDGRIVDVSGMRLFKDSIRDLAILWVRADRCERSVLVHEFGHVLGLTANPAHEQAGNPSHCANPQCVMTHPRWRSILYHLVPGLFAARLPTDYCRDCRADIRRSKELWALSRASDPGFLARVRSERRAGTLSRAAWFEWGRGRNDAALARMREAVAAAPITAWPHAQLARMLEQLGERDAAREAYRTALRMDDDAGTGHLLAYAEMLCERGRYDEAAGALDRPSLRDLSADERFIRAGWIHWTVRLVERAYAGAGRPREALEILEGFLHIGELPRTMRESTLGVLARISRRMGDTERALAYLDRMPRRSRREPQWRIDRARLLLAEGRTGEAAALLDEVAQQLAGQLDEADADTRHTIHFQLAVVHALRGRAEPARASLDALDRVVARSEPGGRAWLPAWAAMQRARVLALIGDAGGALEALAAAAAEPKRFSDPCIDEDLQTLRGEPRFRELFPACSSDGGPAEGTPDGPQPPEA